MLRKLPFSGVMVAGILALTNCSSDKDEQLNYVGIPTPEINGTFVDSRDNQVYKWVKIGDQTWMAENLNYETEVGSWDISKSSWFCEWEWDTYCNDYGRVYDLQAAKIACPEGWHLPSDAEWTILTDYVGGTSTAGTKLKATDGWYLGEGTDDYGFSASPGGWLWNEDLVPDVGDAGHWWSSTDSTGYAYGYSMSYHNNEVDRMSYSVTYGLYVRCVLSSFTTP